ncbi:MAG: cell division protein FtsZ [Candidatus Liptonbacteria bacterium]|nr:cell division protein FtsZ [Candidatus Liptonbacteria bacterium]
MRRKTHPRRTRRNALPVASAAIKVVGVGGGGGNAVSRISRDFVRGVEFIAINTDHQDLDNCPVRTRLYIGRSLTRGLGTGMNPEIGRQAAEENRSDIAEALRGADIVFVTAGFGGGTGTGAGPVVAEVAKQQGALTLGFVTRPFSFEGSQRERIAEEGIGRMKDKVDALVVVSNDQVFSLINKDTPILRAFGVIDDILKNALKGVVELISSPGIVNLDFADVKTILADTGSAIVGIGIGSGENRAAQAVEAALHSPLLEVNPEGSRGILLGISGRNVRMEEVNEAARMVAQTADPAAKVIFGAYYDRRLKASQLKITLIATGFNSAAQAGSLFGGRAAAALFGGTRVTGVLPEDFHGKERTHIQLDEFSSKAAKGGGAAPEAKKPVEKKKEELWDIPSFLRKRKK